MIFSNKLEAQKLDALTRDLVIAARQKGLKKEDAEDFVQTLLLKAIRRFNENPLLQSIAETNPNYFRAYVFKAFKNEMKNIWRKKRPKRHLFDVFMSFIKPKKSNLELNGEKYTVPDLEDEIESEPIQDPEQELKILEKERDKMIKDFIKLLKNDLSEIKIMFLEQYLEMAEKHDKVIIEKIGRKLGLKPTQAHDIKRKIMRKAAHLAAKDRLFSIIFGGLVSTRGVGLIPIGLYRTHVFLLSKCTQNILEHLTPDEIKTLSKIL